jgi:acetyl esterase/lipase
MIHRILQCLIIGALASVFFVVPANAVPGNPIPLWAADVPEAGRLSGTPGDGGNSPTLTPYLPPSHRASGSAVVICPGGGYGGLSEHEAAPIAEWLNSLGVSAFVLRYRLAPRWGHPAPLADAARAIRMVRARAGEWGIEPNRIAIMGFSAGGHVASSAGTHFDAGTAGAADPIERASSRPDLMVLVYPVITMGDATHSGSRKNLLGANPGPELVDFMSSEKQVSPQTPPTFLVHGADDDVVPLENAILFSGALRKAKIPFELHVFEHGVHGFGLATDDPVVSRWTGLLANWLRVHGFIPWSGQA